METNTKMEKKFDGILEQIKRHPYMIAAFLCFACNWFGYCNEKFIDGFMVYGLCVISMGVIGWILYQSVRQKKIKSWVAIAVLAAVFWMEQVFSERFMQYEKKAFVVLVIGVLSVGLLYAWMVQKMPNRRQEILIASLFAIGFVLRFAYVLETDISVRQNDVGYLGDEEGHLGYIMYLLQNHHLPDFDPTSRWQFYHPPLHHSIGAIWMKFCMSFGLEDYVPYEALQALPLFYSCVIMILSYKILCHLKLKGKARVIPFALISFFPYLIILAGALNNDALSICFIMGAIYCTMVWYRNQTVWNIIKTALCIGLGMMTKLSVGLIAPAVAVVFLYVLIKRRNEWILVIRQYVVFGLICCPLGLWWGIRNYFKFGVPFNYIARNPEGMAWQYIGDIPLLKRFCDFNLAQIESPFMQWGDNSYLEYNPTIGMLKSALFGECAFSGKMIEQLCKIVLWVGAVLAVVFFVCFLIAVFEKKSFRVEKGFLALGYLTILGNFYTFCINFPYTCTMNFRYIVPCMLIAAYGTGVWIQKRETKAGTVSKVLITALEGLVILFAVIVLLIYGCMIYTQQ
ncbi:MAG: ArnT family glycosyltransferase [Lachnospiraceae bacterium]